MSDAYRVAVLEFALRAIMGAAQTARYPMTFKGEMVDALRLIERTAVAALMPHGVQMPVECPVHPGESQMECSCPQWHQATRHDPSTSCSSSGPTER